MENKNSLGWLRVKLSDVCYILDNQRIPLNSTERQKRTGSVPYYGATGIIDYIDNFLFDEELLLLGEDGAPFFDKRKDIAFLVNGKSWVNNHAHVLKAANDITTNKFLYYYLNYFDYTGFVGGATRLKLTKTSLTSIPVLLPPIGEQRLIEKKLDDIYDLISKMRERIIRIKEVRESLLHSFLYDEASNPYPFKSLKDYLIEKSGRIGNKWQGIRLVGVDAVKGIIDLRASTKSGYANYKIVEKGDFVYNPMRINIGSIAIYNGSDLVLTSPDYIVFKVRDTFSSSLLLDYLKSPAGLAKISSFTQGSVRARLYFKALIKIKIPIDPNFNRGNVDSAYTVLEKIQDKIPAFEEYLDNLKSSILHKAFLGNLVTYSSRDEEFSLLLTAIENKSKDIILKDFEISKPQKLQIMGSYKNLSEALKDNGGKLTPKQLWEISDYKDDIDAFYASLKKEIEIDQTIEESPEKDYLLAR